MSEAKAITKRESGRFTWLLVCFACSGMSALIYEVAWVRSLELIFGATTFAVATVLAAFMGGLAFGSYFMGRIAGRLRRFHPLRIYGAMECGIGLMALIVPSLFDLLTPLYQLLWREFHASLALFSALRFLLCVLILLVPTSLMGATLPIMSSFVNRDQAGGLGQKRIGLLYTVNTGGAVLGVLAAGFVLFPQVGLRMTQWIAIGLSSAAALGAFVLAAKQAWRQAPEPPAQEIAPASAPAGGTVIPEAKPLVAGLLVLIYAFSGFSAMLYEVAWSRLLVLVLGSSTYAYTIMLATFLFGLAAGAGLATRYLIRLPNALLTASLCQLGVAITSYFGSFVVEELPFVYLKLFEFLEPELTGMMVILFLLSAGLMILPTLGLGAMFPVTIYGLSPTGDKTARKVGWAYSLNTVGAIGGSVAAGFWLLPSLGTQTTLLVGVAINSAMALTGVLACREGRLARYRAATAGLLAVFTANLFLSTPAWEPHTLASGIFRYVRNYSGTSHDDFYDRIRQTRGEIVYFKEGLTCTITVYRTTGSLTLLVNGKPDASAPPGLPLPAFARQEPPLNDLPTQVLLGQIPLLLAPKKDRIMVIGLGSGVTLGSVLRHEAKAVECVELEHAVVEGSRWFDPFSGRPLNDSRVQMVVNDARNHLLVTDQQYDVIVSEPSNPWIPGAATLFTREFFEMAKRKMPPGGIFCQWVQLYELDETDLKMIIRTFRSVFAHLHIFRVDSDAIIVGTSEPLPLELTKIEAAMSPANRQDLARIAIRDARDLLAYYWIGGAQIKREIPEGLLNTDDNMHIEFKAPLRVLVQNPNTDQALRKLFAPESTGLIPQSSALAQDRGTNSEFWAELAEASLRHKRPDLALDYARHALTLDGNARAASVYSETLLGQRRLEEAGKWWRAEGQRFKETPAGLRALTRYYLETANWTSARQSAERLLESIPDDLEARYMLGKSLVRLQEWSQALPAFGPLLKNHAAETNWADLPKLAGILWWNQQRYAESAAALQAALERDHWDLEARELLADSLTRLGQRSAAVLEWQRLGQLRSSLSRNRYQEALEALQRGETGTCRAKLEEAYALDPWDEDISFALARARSRAGEVAQAIVLLEKYLAWDKDRGWAVGYLGQLYGKAGEADQGALLAQRYHALTGKPWMNIEE